MGRPPQSVPAVIAHPELAGNAFAVESLRVHEIISSISIPLPVSQQQGRRQNGNHRTQDGRSNVEPDAEPYQFFQLLVILLPVITADHRSHAHHRVGEDQQGKVLPGRSQPERRRRSSELWKSRQPGPKTIGKKKHPQRAAGGV